MALIRGVGSLHPCPRCLIHEDSLGYANKTADLRMTESTKIVLENARSMRYAMDKEDILKASGLRDIDVCL
jgi:hypothetical protein